MSKTDNGRFTAKKIASLGILTALSLITFLLENLIVIPIPGARLGFANLFSFIALIIYSPLEAFIIVGVRTFLGAVFAGNLSAVMYSFTGGMVSMGISSLLMYLCHPKISVMSISVAAAVAHNVTQTAVYALMYSTPAIFVVYTPYLALLGAASGAFIGAVATLIVKKVPCKTFVGLLGVKNFKQ